MTKKVNQGKPLKTENITKDAPEFFSSERCKEDDSDDENEENPLDEQYSHYTKH
jgi:hypothetical protein